MTPRGEKAGEERGCHLEEMGREGSPPGGREAWLREWLDEWD